jgi:hypothetical protein
MIDKEKGACAIQAANGSPQATEKPYKILHYKHNPAAAASHRQESLRVVQLEAENTALRDAVSRLSEGSLSEDGNVGASDQLEKEALKNKVTFCTPHSNVP